MYFFYQGQKKKIKVNFEEICKYPKIVVRLSYLDPNSVHNWESFVCQYFCKTCIYMTDFALEQFDG